VSNIDEQLLFRDDSAYVKFEFSKSVITLEKRHFYDFGNYHTCSTQALARYIYIHDLNFMFSETRLLDLSFREKISEKALLYKK